MVTTVTSKGQLTLPIDVRRRLGIEPGDKVDFIVRDDGTAEMRPVRGSLRDLYGALPRPERPATLDEMQAAIEKGAAS